MNAPRSLKLESLLLCGLLAGGLCTPMTAGWMPRVQEAIRSDGLNQIDLQRQERGYYENLLSVGRDISQPAAAQQQQQQPAAPPFLSTRLALTVEDVRETILKPSFQTMHMGVPWTTNSLGLRDREYLPEKPPATVRIALLGDSIAAAWGVADGQGFEPLLEEALNRDSASRGGPAIEIWNFAVPGHAPGQRFEHFVRAGGWNFGFDLVLYEATPADVGWDVHRLRRLLPEGKAFDAPVYQSALAELGIRPGGDAESYKRRLRPYRWEIIGAVYDHIIDQCRARRVPCAWVMIPRVGKAADQQDRDHLRQIARESGFAELLDLTNAWDGLDPLSLAVAPEDYHPNALGHEKLATRLAESLSRSPFFQAVTLQKTAPNQAILGGPPP